MTTAIFRFAIAIALAAAAWLSWSEADRAGRLAGAKQQIATLQHAEVDRNVDPATAATVAYWLGQYGSVTADTGGAAADAHLLQTVAHAAFREYQREPGAGRAAVLRLDGVLQSYVAALKASAQSPSPALGAEARRSLGEVGAEAAYNYEYVARIRDQVARAGPAKTPAAAPAPALAAKAGDLPIGRTIHGGPGMPPPDAKLEELEMLAPMDYGDRETQPQATPGAKRERKG